MRDDVMLWGVLLYTIEMGDTVLLYIILFYCISILIDFDIEKCVE